MSNLADVIWINTSNKYVFKQEEFPKVVFYNDKDLERIGIKGIISHHKPIDIVIFEDLYNLNFCQIAKVLDKSNIPYIIVPRGGLCEAAQAKKKIKKTFGNLLFFNRYIRRAASIHYLTQNEADDSGIKWNKNYFIIPNGVYLPKETSNVGSHECIKGVFIGRIDIYHKGIDILLSALKQNESFLLKKNVSIFIYGSDLIGDSERVRSIIEEKRLGGIVTLEGPVYDSEKEKVLREADFFILTSRFEGHPTGLLEALSYGLPSLVTYGSNMGEEIQRCAAGWVSETDEKSLEKTINDMLSTLNNISSYGKNARKLAENYSWGNVVKQIYDQLELIIK